MQATCLAPGQAAAAAVGGKRRVAYHALPPAGRLARPFTLSSSSGRRTLLCRAEQPEQPEQQQQQAESPQPAAKPAVVDPSVAAGQRTAIITGVISIVFGVIYLALVFFLDMRGGEMLPPPPEAYGL